MPITQHYQPSKLPSVKNWTNITSRDLARRLIQLARTKPSQYAYFKKEEADALTKSLNRKLHIL